MQFDDGAEVKLLTDQTAGPYQAPAGSIGTVIGGMLEGEEWYKVDFNLPVDFLVRGSDLESAPPGE
jgi:hypothetical protein